MFDTSTSVFDHKINSFASRTKHNNSHTVAINHDSADYFFILLLTIGKKKFIPFADYNEIDTVKT